MFSRRKLLAATTTAAFAGCIEQVGDEPPNNSTAASGDPGDDESMGYQTTRAIEAQEVSLAVPGEALRSASVEDSQSDILAGGQVLVGADLWVNDGEVQTGTLARENADVLFSVDVLEEWDVPGLREAAASGGLSPADAVFPGNALISEDFRTIEGATLVRVLDEEDGSESEFAGFLEASGALIPGDMWGATVNEETEASRGYAMFYSGDSFFPGGMWSPGDEVIPGGMWFPSEEFFPGGMWSSSDSLFPGGMWSFGEQLFRDDMAFIQGSGGLDEHHADLDPDWLALLENGGILLPSDTFIAARGGPSVGS